MTFKFSMLKPQNSEQEILGNRVILGTLAAIACFALDMSHYIVSCFIVYLLLNSVLILLERKSIFPEQVRWFAAVLLDVSMATTTMWLDPVTMAWAYIPLMWMILGNGFRFGLKWLFIASAVSTMAFGILVATTPTWQAQPILGYSLVGSLIIIPAYCSTLIRKISFAKDQAEAASRAKSYFLASVSHELRTPLNAILGYGNHLRQMGLPPRQHNMIDASVLAAEHLLHLIEQLIQVAKTESGSAQVNNADFRITDILTEVRDIMAVRASDKGLELNLQAEPYCDQMVSGPANMIRNVMLNLVSNAVKFTSTGSVSIFCSVENNADGKQLSFRVVDTGIGIAEDAVAKIFQPFQQADDSVMDRFGGTGLGLAICTQISEQIGGTINVKSELGKGSEFIVTVPIFEPSQQTDVLTECDKESIRILSLGKFEPELIANTQSIENFIVRHIDCETIEDVENALNESGLGNYKIALCDENLVRLTGADHPIWEKFASAEIATILVQSGEKVELEDVGLRAAFATIIPASPDFDILRSAIRIGCSFKRSSYAESKDAEEKTAIITPRNILVADDNRTNRNVLAAILENVGHVVTMVEDGDDALTQLEQNSFDILLLDVNMPRLNGIEMASMWRQIEGSRSHMPIIGVTADATSETEERCLAAGMDIRVTKPFDSNKLLALIEDYTRKDGEKQNISADDDPLEIVVPISGAKKDANDVLDPTQMEYLHSIGDDDFVKEMISSFVADISESIEPMRSSVACKDVHKFRFYAHAFKSSAHNIGATQLGKICAKLEHITEGQFSENAEIYLGKVEKALEDIQNALDISLIESETAVNQ